MHRFPRRQHQAEQADLLVGQHLALRARPVRIEMLARQQLRHLGDHPVRLDRGIGQAPHALGVQQGGGQHPGRRLAGQRRTGKQLKATLARRQEVALLGAMAHLRRQAGDQRPMQRLVGGAALA